MPFLPPNQQRQSTEGTHCQHMPINKIWMWTESTPRSGWWRSHMAGIYSDCSTHEIIINNSVRRNITFTHESNKTHRFCLDKVSNRVLGLSLLAFTYKKVNPCRWVLPNQQSCHFFIVCLIVLHDANVLNMYITYCHIAVCFKQHRNKHIIYIYLRTR